MIIKVASYGELGLYTAAMQWNSIILFIPGILRNVILNHLSEANSDEMKHSRLIKLTLLINLSITLILALFVFLFSTPIIRLYGLSFDGLDYLISIAVLITVFSSMSDVYTQAYMSKGMNWLMLYIRIVRDAGIILVFLFIVKTTSLKAAESLIYSSLIMNFIFLIIMTVVYRMKKTEGDLNIIIGP